MGWISVDDRLPKDMSLGCIVYYENDCADMVSTADVFLSSDGFCIMHKGEWKPIVGVTHWMKLPEPPTK